jgi:hypothetical protein
MSEIRDRRMERAVLETLAAAMNRYGKNPNTQEELDDGESFLYIATREGDERKMLYRIEIHCYKLDQPGTISDDDNCPGEG